MIKFKNYLLTEATHRVQKDVDYIYNKLFKEYYDSFMRGRPVKFRDTKIESLELPSKVAKEASRMNSVSISGIGNMGTMDGNASGGYDAIYHHIIINVNEAEMMSVIDYYMQLKIGTDPAKLELTSDDVNDIYNIITGKNTRITILHELVHWIDDSKYKHQIGKESGRGIGLDNELSRYLPAKERRIKEKERRKLIDLISNPTNTHEANARVHQVETLKASMSSSKWNRLSMGQMMALDGSLLYMYKFAVKNDSFKFMKVFTKRLHREGLLGKNMKSIIWE